MDRLGQGSVVKRITFFLATYQARASYRAATARAARALARAAAVLVAILVAACAGSSDTENSPASTGGIPQLRWEQYQTFGFVSDSVRSGTVAATLRAEVTRQMNARGLRQASDPDLLVHLAVDLKERLQVPGARNTGGAAARYPFLEEYYRQLPPGHDTDLERITDGYLTIDLLDVQLRQKVWRGQAKRRVTERVVDNPQPTLAAVVDEIFRRFPLSR